jgi:hypothetical protein
LVHFGAHVGVSVGDYLLIYGFFAITACFACHFPCDKANRRRISQMAKSADKYDAGHTSASKEYMNPLP